MNRLLLGFAAFMASLSLLSQQTVDGTLDGGEIRFIQEPFVPNAHKQQVLRERANWQQFLQEHGTWYVYFDELSGMPIRGFGKPIPVTGNSSLEMAQQFISENIAAFGMNELNLEISNIDELGKYQWVNFKQFHNGLEVLDSRVTVKLLNDKVVLFACEAFQSIELNAEPALGISSLETAAQAGLPYNVVNVVSEPNFKILPIEENGEYVFHQVAVVTVKTISPTGIPARYYTLVDTHTGAILYRSNLVKHHGPSCSNKCTGHPTSMPVVVNTAVTGSVYVTNPNDPATTVAMPNIDITVSGTSYISDANGENTLPVNPGLSGQVRLMGPWARVYTNNVTPGGVVTLQDGDNAISVNSTSTTQERTAYWSVQVIHDHMSLWMPDFDGMDFQLPTNVDVAGECNAFYDGASINFYAAGGGCNASALIPDVAWHEYGHGINDNFYTSLGSLFQNGAMGEGYADFWAMSISDSPQLGVGFNVGNLDPIRRYDIDPKVYPIDLVGEVHADGEIIMGAWYDTHLLMGGDWNWTMPLFVEAYAGLQAATFNGNEGEAFLNVLIDVLQADDDDGDITNGTPNGNAIVQGFDMHGITLLSNAVLSHSDIEFATQNDDIDIDATLILDFEFQPYLQTVELNYKVNSGSWQTMDMTNTGGNQWSAIIPGQETGSVIYYYINSRDINNTISSVRPIGAAQSVYPNLPYIILVDVQEMGVQDSDNNEFWGAWQTGLASDNASTGEWILEVPLPSYTVDVSPGTIVQPGTQVTPGGEYCFVTGNASSTSAGIGENDVDAGRTTLQSPTMDFSIYNDPVVAYYRWYTNSPPGGANPGADWWQVLVSNNNGQTWTYVENNQTSDASWRRNAFRVADIIQPTDQMRFRFIASDSTQLGQNLDGGSLVEAAMDDFIVYDEYITSTEDIASETPAMTVYPNPATDYLELNYKLNYADVVYFKLYNEEGKVVFEVTAGNKTTDRQTTRINLPQLAPGKYWMEMSTQRERNTQPIIVR